MSIEWRSINLCAPEERNIYSRGDSNPNTRQDHIFRTYANLAHGGRFFFNPLNPPYQGDL